MNEINNDEDKEKNDIIKIKNLICTTLYYINDIDSIDFSAENSKILNILKEFKKHIKSDRVNNDFVLPKWYINSLII